MNVRLFYINHCNSTINKTVRKLKFDFEIAHSPFLCVCAHFKIQVLKCAQLKRTPYPDLFQLGLAGS